MSDAAQCAICGAPVEPGRLPGLLFLGRRWFFCGAAHRTAFKRDPERSAQARPEAGRPEAEGRGALPRERAPSPFRVRRRIGRAP